MPRPEAPHRAGPAPGPAPQGVTLTVQLPAQPSLGEGDPRVPFSLVMLARDDTAQLLARALFRNWARSRVARLQAGTGVALAAVLATVVGYPVAAGVLAAAAATPLLVAARCARTGRAMAPAGFTLGLGLGPGHLAVRHAAGTSVTAYSDWASVTGLGSAVVLRARTGRVLALPAELVGADAARLRALVEGAQDAVPAA